jgi:hypothetical protein
VDEQVKHYGVAGGGCACGWRNDGGHNMLRTLHMYDHNPDFKALIDEFGWPRD